MSGGLEPIGAERLQRIEKLFDQALEIPPQQRDAWLREACGDDSDLLTTLQTMLAFDQQQPTDLAQGVGRLALDATEPRDRSGERIGRYRLLSRIRYGGMAEIYAAMRDDGEFAHDVALKISRRDRRKPEDMARLFAAERGVLAQLRHPHICQIFDGGTTADGESWFVMERLEGEPLLTACRRDGVSWKRIIDHFLDLCAAVAHTHRQLVIHRDIKPDNVLLADGPQGPVVKLLDFGIAGSLGEQTADDTRQDKWYSASHAAPEIVAGETGGVGADVYSLGRLLGELAEQFPRSRRGEIERIARHASQHEPANRYADVELLAEDLRRVRDRKPISLLAKRRTYVTWRFMQRRAVWLVAIAALALATTLFLLNEQQRRFQAEAATAVAVAQRDRANRIRDFLLEAYESADPASNQGKDLMVADLLEQQVSSLDTDQTLDSGVRSELLGTLGQALLGLGHYPQATAALKEAAQLADQAGSSGAALWAKHTILLGQSLRRGNHSGDAEVQFRRVEERHPEWASAPEALRLESQLYSSWGPLAYHLGRFDDAEQMIRKGLQARVAWAEMQDIPAETSSLLVTLGAIQSRRGHLREALATFEEAYTKHRADGHQFTFPHLALLGWIGITLDKLGRAEAAEPYLKEAIEVAEQLFSKPHTKLSGAYGNLGAMYLANGRLDEAEPLLRKAMKVVQALGDSSSPVYQTHLQNLALLTLAHENLAASRPMLEEALNLRRADFGEAHKNTMRTRNALGSLSLLQGQPKQAREQARAVIALLDAAEHTADSELTTAELLAAQAQATLGDAIAARRLLQRTDAWLAQHRDDQRVQADASLARAQTLRLLGDSAAAHEAFKQAIKHYQAAFPNGHPGQAKAQLGLAELCAQQGDLVCARENLAASAPLLERLLAADGPSRKAWQRLADRLN